MNRLLDWAARHPFGAGLVGFEAVVLQGAVIYGLQGWPNPFITLAAALPLGGVVYVIATKLRDADPPSQG
jgi:hypothetical protein